HKEKLPLTCRQPVPVFRQVRQCVYKSRACVGAILAAKTIQGVLSLSLTWSHRGLASLLSSPRAKIAIPRRLVLFTRSIFNPSLLWFSYHTCRQVWCCLSK